MASVRAPNGAVSLYQARTFERMGVQPILVFEQGAKRKRYLTMLIAFRTRRKLTGIAQNVASKLDNFRLGV
jgi:hypothetical protein